MRLRMGVRQVRPIGACLAWLVAGLLLAPLAVHAAPPAQREPSPILLSASEIDYPPFAVVDALRRADGFSVQLLREAMRAMGYQVAFEVGPWEEVRGWLESGRVQALPLVGRTPEREALYDFTFPYLTMHGALVVRESDVSVRTLADLAGRDVAVLAGDNAEEFLRREPRDFRIHTTDTFEEALRGVVSGAYDAVLIQRLVAVRLIEAGQIRGLRIVERPVTGFSQEFCFAVRQGDSETLALLNEGLSIVMADGTFRRLHARWLGSTTLPVAGRIVVGGDDNYPPYEYLDENGQPTGYLVALTRAVANEMGLDVEIRLAPWGDTRQALLDGEIDVIQGMFYSHGRDALYDFGTPHTLVDHVAAYRVDSVPEPGSLAELAGLRVVVMQGDIMQDHLADEPSITWSAAVSSEEQALRLVADGDADVALVARVPARYWIAANGWENLEVARTPLERSEYGYAVAEGRGELLASFEEGLQALEASGELRRIRTTWLGAYEEPAINLLRALRYAGVVLVPLVLILVGSMVWSRQLSGQVARRTEELRRSEAQFQAMIEGAPEPILVEVAGGEIRYANPAAVALLGAAAAEDLHGRSVMDFIVPEQREAVLARMRELDATGGDAPSQEETLIRLDGALREVLASAVPIDYGGEPAGLVFLSDITERKRAEDALRESERRLSVLMANLPGMAYRCEAGGDFTPEFLSEGCLALTGYRPEELMGERRYQDLMHPDDDERIRGTMRAALSSGRPYSHRYRIIRQDGREAHVWEQGRVVPGEDGQPRIEGLVLDITEQVLAQQEVARQMDELQRWQQVMLAREGRVRELKHQVNALYAERGLPPPYPSQEAAPGGDQEHPNQG